MDIMSLTTAMPGAFAQGLIWGIMAIGVYITFRILYIADLTVDGNIILDIKGEDKKKLTVEDLFHKFEEASGEEFASDKALLG